jgi:hypothetical protein
VIGRDAQVPGMDRRAAAVARCRVRDIDKQVFTANPVNPNAWTNHLFTTDVAINWYWNSYLRVMFDWPYAGFASQVFYAPGGFSRSRDLFLVRLEVRFWRLRPPGPCAALPKRLRHHPDSPRSSLRSASRAAVSPATPESAGSVANRRTCSRKAAACAS